MNFKTIIMQLIGFLSAQVPFLRPPLGAPIQKCSNPAIGSGALVHLQYKTMTVTVHVICCNIYFLHLIC